MDPQTALISLTAILVLGISAKWTSWASQVPSILLLLLLGLIVGPITGWIQTDELFGGLLLPIVSLSVAVILFEGGLSLCINEFKNLGAVIISLVTIGAFISYMASTLFLYYVLNFSWTFSLLESAILIVTGPTVVIPLIEHLNIKEPTKSILRWEGIVIDPIGATAAVLILEALFQQTTAEAIEAISFGVVKTLVIGIVLGVVAAYLILLILRRFLISDELQNPVVLMFVLGTFALSDIFQEDSGLITVTIMGLILANQGKTKVRHIADFKENLKIILIGFLFITLASSIDIKSLKDTFPESLALLIFLIFVARPLGVVIATIFSGLKWKDIIFLSFMAPRGIIAAAISALFGLLLARINYPEAPVFAPMTFTIIAGTVIFYSIVTPLLAKRLKISGIPDQGVMIIGANRVARMIGEALHNAAFKVQLIDIDYRKVTETKKQEIPVYYGPFITYETAKPDGMKELGKLFAMTERDDVNSLAISHFHHHFDDANMYQLAPVTEKIPLPFMGRILYGDEYTFDKLSRLIDEGYIVKTTSLTNEFSYRNWREMYGTDSIPLFYIRKNGILIPVTKITPIPQKEVGQIVFMTKENAESKNA